MHKGRKTNGRVSRALLGLCGVGVGVVVVVFKGKSNGFFAFSLYCLCPGW